MGKLTIQEIAKILVKKNKLTTKEANQFASMMFEIIQQNLNEEGQVKIKGFGTFKMIRVEARESVSVRTGERVLIDSHAKITFTPDATMKELVNKPFSQFDTVILNDGVEFEDIPDEEPEEEQEEVTAPAPMIHQVVDQPVVPEQPVDVETEQQPTEVEPEEQPVEVETEQQPTEVEQEEQPVEVETEQQPTDVELEQQPMETETALPLITDQQYDEREPGIAFDGDEQTGSWNKTVGYVLLTLVLMAASAYVGFWCGKSTDKTTIEEPIVETPQVVPVDSIEIITADSIENLDESAINEPQQEQTQEVKPEAKPAQPAAEVKLGTKPAQPVAEVKPEAKPAQPAAEEESFWKKYEAMDARVRTGAYHIVGTDHEVKVRKGETLSRIARHELGEGMSCYIEVYNDLKPNTPLQEGQIIKIPKLKWKKKRTNN